MKKGAIFSFYLIFLFGNTQLFSQNPFEWHKPYNYHGQQPADTYTQQAPVVTEQGDHYVHVGDTSDPLLGYFEKVSASGLTLWRSPAFYAFSGFIKIAPNGNVLVVIPGASVVCLDQSTGTILWTSSNPVYDLAFDGGGNILCFDFTNIPGWLEKLDPQGNSQWVRPTAVTPPAYYWNSFMHVDGENNILFYSDHGILWKLDTLGNTIFQIATDTGYTYHNPVMDSRNGIYNWNGDYFDTIEKYDKTGNLVSQISPVTQIGAVQIFDIVIDSLDNYYLIGFVDSANMGFYTLYVQKGDVNGNVLWELVYKDTMLYMGVDGLIGTDGYLYINGFKDASQVLIYNTGFVAKISPGGNILDQIEYPLDNASFGAFSQDMFGAFYLATYYDVLVGQYFMDMYKLCTGNCTPNISGKVYIDANQNCTHDNGEDYGAGKIMVLSPGQYSITDSNGYYSFYRPIGNYLLSVTQESYWTSTCPSNNQYTITLTPQDSISENNDFGIYLDPTIQDLNISLAGTPVRPGFNQNYTINYSNIANPANGTVTLTLDTILQWVSSTPAPDNVTGNVYTWNYTSLQPYESRCIHFETITDQTLALGTPYSIIATVNPVVGDTTPSDNTDIVTGIVTGSFDPNDKAVIPNRDLYLGEDKLTYTIRFQNTGTDTAFTVVVTDTLDPSLDITTTKMGAASHAYTWDISGNNVIRWRFANILLPDSNVNEPASHGFIKFSIQLNDNIATGTAISNSAAIYFDFNAPVITNTVTNVKTDLSGVREIATNISNLRIYPNPFEDRFNIYFDNIATSDYTATVTDIAGKEIFRQRLSGIAPIDMGSISAGVYLVRVVTCNTTYQGRLVKAR